eukprot:6200930-Pleurochrysis_carterae.AAC.1
MQAIGSHMTLRACLCTLVDGLACSSRERRVAAHVVTKLPDGQPRAHRVDECAKLLEVERGVFDACATKFLVTDRNQRAAAATIISIATAITSTAAAAVAVAAAAAAAAITPAVVAAAVAVLTAATAHCASVAPRTARDRQGQQILSTAPKRCAGHLLPQRLKIYVYALTRRRQQQTEGVVVVMLLCSGGQQRRRRVGLHGHLAVVEEGVGGVGGGRVSDVAGGVGEHVRHCRAADGRLQAERRRLLGV